MDLAKTLRLDAIDRFQQRHTSLAFPVAVLKKLNDDHGGQLAALISYYGFISLFPLLLVFFSILGFVLQGDPSLQRQIREGTLGQFPLISKELEEHVAASGVALGVGTLLTLLGGLAVTNVSQLAFNRIWSVPFTQRPNFLIERLRGLFVLLALGALTIIATLAGGFVGASNHQTASFASLAAGVLISLAANLLLFLAAFKLLTAADIASRKLLPGACLAAVFWTLLQYFGGLYLSHQMKHLGPLYGTFALVLGLLAWLYLGAHLTLIAAEVNVVLDRRLWPRTYFGSTLLDADRRALKAAALAQDRNAAEHIEVRFDGAEAAQEDRSPARSRPRRDASRS